MKKLFKIIYILVGISILLFGIYIYKLHSLAIEGNRIFELRCTAVNPPLIAYKNAFLKQADIMNRHDTSKSAMDDYFTYYKDYISEMKKYIIEENKWLEIEKKYQNRWDFKLLEPWYMKQAGEYQLKMYEAYRDDAQIILDIGDKKVIVDSTYDYSKSRRKLDDAKQKYFDFFDYASALSDWRKIFSYLPVPTGCTEENMTIPSTSGSINWNGTPTPQPKGIPGVEDISG